jgi:isochorismate synthase EntC
MAIRQTHSEMSPAAVEDFLKSGWCLALGSDRVLVGWGPGEWAEAPSDAECALFAPDFYLETPQPWWLSRNWWLTTHDRLRRLLRSHVSNLPASFAPRGSHRSWQEPSRDGFQAVFEHLQESFRSGIAAKAVPVVFSSLRERVTAAFIARHLLHALEHATETLRPYGFWQAGEGILGVTPEILFRADGQRLETMALAGTRRGDLTDAEAAAFLQDPKESYEHRLVVEDIHETLSAFGSVELGRTRVLRLPKLNHLLTPIHVRLTQPAFAFDELALRLHPTPALGVAPRRLGLNWMRTWDPERERGRFGAPFGVQAKIEGRRTAECLVAIRNIQWRADDVRLGSGCGVVSRSEFLAEWRELEVKRQAVRALLGL